MWKPGTPSPAAGKNSNKKKDKQQKSKRSEEFVSPHLKGSESIRSNNNATGTATTAMSTPKRLSGATMNMRFMKRKQETQEQERERKRVAQERAQASMAFETTTTTTTTIATTSPTSALSATVLTTAAPSPHISAPSAAEKGFKERNDDDNDDMDMDEPAIEGYQAATPIDIYGLQAALLGRRSFGGFNTAIEDAWKESKESLEMDAAMDRPNRKKQQQATEEELIQQYHDIVKKRSESSRAVGNLKDKGRRQRR